ncbi:serine hydrolase domain-containing protein [Paenibacillus sepulcri]|uniref:Beta-lactamase family protein n=1 Tax=Paenibacillus sepulcri TaxID=359917 RepID=A0ABS7C3J5_9BACL|nr:beta-lactamase family protein [Paenibacillus sepulcri]
MINKLGLAAFMKVIAMIAILGGLIGFQPGSAYAETNIETARIDRFIQSRMDKNNIPGLAVAIVHDDQIVYSKGFGQSGNGKPVTVNTPFAIASLSKSITALAVMQLVEAGKVSLDVPITDYIPSFKVDDPRGPEITVRQLLNQTSGLADSVFPEMAFRKQPGTLEESIARFKNVKLASNPGQQFHYHNPNYQLLARIVEVVSRESFSGYLQKHIFNPLQMNHTADAANTRQFSEADGQFSSGHIFLYGKPVVKKEPDWFVEGAAGNISTVEDMAHWLILQLNGGKYEGVRLLSSEGIKTMHSAPAGTDSTYGMGWSEDGSKIDHNGLLWTYYADQVLMPESGYGIVVLFNSGLNMLVNYSSFTAGLSDILGGQQPKETFFSGQTLEILIGLLTVVTLGLGIHSFFRMKKWEERYTKRAKWLTWVYILLRLVPLAVFICLPKILFFIAGGRVLNGERIFLIMPSFFILLMLASMFGVIHAVGRMVRMYRIMRVK